jgi:hypothetical protein
VPSKANRWSTEISFPKVDERANVVLLSGRIIERLEDRNRDDELIVVVLVSFDVPDERARETAVVSRVEVPNVVAAQHLEQLSAGKDLVVIGRLTVGGGIWATAIAIHQPRHRRSDELRG